MDRTVSGWARATAIFAGASALLGMSSPPEIETGTRVAPRAPVDISDSLRLTEQEKARVALISFGECTVSRNLRQAERYAGMKYDDPETAKLLSRLATSDCLREGSIKMSSLLLRGAVFIGLYRSRFSRSPLAFGAEPTDFASEFVDMKSPNAGAIAIVREFGDCVVRAVPDASRALVVAAPATKAELAAFNDVSPQLGPCLAQGSKVTLNKLMLTGVLGEALYRLSSRAAAPAASAGNSNAQA